MDSNQEINKFMNDEYWQNIQKYKEKYFGAQDEHFKNNYPNNNKVNLIYNKTVVIEPLGVIGENRSCRFEFPKLDANKFVYKNLKLNSNQYDNIINKCILECNGSYLDTIYGRTFKTLRYLYNIEDSTILPFSFNIGDDFLSNNISTNINMQFSNGDLSGFELSVDIFEIDDDNFNEYTFTYNNIITQCQYNGMEVVSKGSNVAKYKVQYNHVMNYILVSIPNTNINHIILQLDGYNVVDISTENILCYDNHYIIPLTKSLHHDYINTYGINFSRCDNSVLCLKYDVITDESNTPLYIYGISSNAIKIQNKMAGLMYSK